MSSVSQLVVIGGGTGFIGTALRQALQNKGYETIVISRKQGPNSRTWNDLQQYGLPMGTTAVVSLAGQNVLDPTRYWTEGFKQNVFASRVNTTRYLAQAIERSEIKPKVFVSTSGVGFYPPTSVEYDENGPGGDFDFLSRLCTEWEKATILPANMSVRTVIIRSGVVLGRHGGMIKQLYVPFYCGLGGPVGSGKQPMPWIHITDLANLFIHSIENESAEGVMNGVAPQIITNKDFAKAFGKALARPSFIPLPTAILNMLFSAERAKIMTEGQKVIPKKAQKLGFMYKYPNITSACEEIATKTPLVGK